MKKPEWFIVSNSFAAPFFSDSGEHWVKAVDARGALEKLAKTYKHPCGLYSAAVYRDANAYHKGAKPLARWLSNHVLAMEEATKGKSRYSSLCNAPGDFEIDGKKFTVENPKGGKVVA